MKKKKKGNVENNLERIEPYFAVKIFDRKSSKVAECDLRNQFKVSLCPQGIYREGPLHARYRTQEQAGDDAAKWFRARMRFGDDIRRIKKSAFHPAP